MPTWKKVIVIIIIIIAILINVIIIAILINVIIIVIIIIFVMVIITDHSKAHHFCAAPFISSLEVDVNYRQINLKLFNTLEGQNLLIKDLSLTQRRRQIEKMGRRHPLNTWATKIIAIRSTGNNIHVLSASFQFDCCME